MAIPSHSSVYRGSTRLRDQPTITVSDVGYISPKGIVCVSVAIKPRRNKRRKNRRGYLAVAAKRLIGGVKFREFAGGVWYAAGGRPEPPPPNSYSLLSHQPTSSKDRPGQVLSKIMSQRGLEITTKWPKTRMKVLSRIRG